MADSNLELQESGWEELRREARKIEGDLDVKLSSYAKLSARFNQGAVVTQSVSNEVVAHMREILDKDNQNLTTNSFLLDDDLSIPFSTEDIDMAIPAIDPANMEAPSFLSEYPCARFLSQNQNDVRKKLTVA